jgi:hypothetical protein
MKGELQKGRILCRGKEVFIGVDDHKESWHVTARTEGEEVLRGCIPSQYHALQRLVDHFKDCKVKVAYEALKDFSQGCTKSWQTMERGCWI